VPNLIKDTMLRTGVSKSTVVNNIHGYQTNWLIIEHLYKMVLRHLNLMTNDDDLPDQRHVDNAIVVLDTQQNMIRAKEAEVEWNRLLELWYDTTRKLQLQTEYVKQAFDRADADIINAWTEIHDSYPAFLDRWTEWAGSRSEPLIRHANGEYLPFHPENLFDIPPDPKLSSGRIDPKILQLFSRHQKDQVPQLSPAAQLLIDAASAPIDSTPANPQPTAIGSTLVEEN
jgi:hypothetical protein